MPRKAKKINISLVAKQADVSPASVSRVLNNHPDVSETLRKRVMQVIEKNNFSPDKAVQRQMRVNIIIGVGDITDYIATILTGMELAANEENIEISIQRCTGRISLLRFCRIWRSDAVVIISGNRLLPEVPSLAEAGLPSMLINCRTDDPSGLIGYIYNDTRMSTMQLLRYLNAQGHRRIAYLAGSPDTVESYRERLGAYRDFMVSIGESPEQFVVSPYPIGHVDGLGRDKEAGYQQAMQLFARKSEETALVCANDEIAFGCYKACFDCGKRIPEDISIAGCDDQSFAKYVSPGLTTIRLQLTQTGRRAIHYLADYLRGKLTELPREHLPSELVIRSSVVAPSASQD